MPRQKAEMELLPPDDEQPKRGRKKLVEAEHTIKYSAPVPVAVEDAEADEIIIEEGFEEVPERKRKPQKNERDELRKKLSVSGVTPGSNLKLAIERYRHAESAEGGVWAETESCTNYACDEAHITSEAYLDVARKWGEGRYRFTLRMNNKIVTAWDKWIRSAIIQGQQVLQHSIPGDPTSPQVIVQMPQSENGAAVMPSMRDMLKAQKEAFKDQLEMMKLARDAFGFAGNGDSQPHSEEDAIASAVIKRPEVLETIIGGIVNKFQNSETSDPGWSAVAMEAVKNGQMAEIAGVIVRELVAPFKNLWGQNGQTQMANPQQPTYPASHSSEPMREVSLNQMPREQQTNGVLPTQANEQAAIQNPAITPQDELLYFLIDACEQNAPIDQVCAQINLSLVRWPELGDSLDALISLPIQQLLMLAVQLRPSLANAQHAQTWLESLMTALTVQEGESNES